MHKKRNRSAREMKDELKDSQDLERPEGEFRVTCTQPMLLPSHEHSVFAAHACCRGFFFLTAPLAITSYHTNKTRLAEAPFGPCGDDNGRRYKPQPRDRIGIATAFVPSRRWSPAAPGKPSFPYFKADYLPRRREQF
ncbi:hypothetical protein THAOC_00342 [Thalassiosira oceanica]|uniref:Uncharacterized protein n=1 Tax=Thalassiosira oceanica TaxID=159749 RepID=K0TRH4_THAOC|nr:hypothetical protein THAOC_00342 [Thalassiosira oceanica]|eukprot:EJK77802.1 hypothetical protein THAOC_00342 [Thalassiosira oceanica]